MIIENIQQIEMLKRQIHKTAQETVEKLKILIQTTSSLEVLHQIKFQKIGFDPIKGTELNVIEQLNQLFSDLVAMEALKDLLLRYPEKKFSTHLGAESGFDIESTDGQVVAECFAVTSASSNGKLKRDSEKLVEKAQNMVKYIYFYSGNDEDAKLEKVYEKFSEIIFVRVTKF